MSQVIIRVRSDVALPLRTAIKPSHKHKPSKRKAQSLQAVQYDVNQILDIANRAGANLQPVHDLVYGGAASAECNADFTLLVPDDSVQDTLQRLREVQSVEACYLKAATGVPTIPSLIH